MILVNLTLPIICLDGACSGPYGATRTTHDYIRAIYDSVLDMHDIRGTTHVYIKMNVRVPVVTITPSCTYTQTGVGITAHVFFKKSSKLLCKQTC